MYTCSGRPEVPLWNCQYFLKQRKRKKFVTFTSTQDILVILITVNCHTLVNVSFLYHIVWLTKYNINRCHRDFLELIQGTENHLKTNFLNMILPCLSNVHSSNTRSNYSWFLFMRSVNLQKIVSESGMYCITIYSSMNYFIDPSNSFFMNFMIFIITYIFLSTVNCFVLIGDLFDIQFVLVTYLERFCVTKSAAEW